jgi:hypothetical protein
MTVQSCCKINDNMSHEASVVNRNRIIMIMPMYVGCSRREATNVTFNTEKVTNDSKHVL